MNKKRFNKLKELCEGYKKANKELSERLLNFYGGTTGKCYIDFLSAFPNVENKRSKLNKEFKDFGIDFNCSDGYLDTQSILMILNSIEKEGLKE